MEIWNVVYLLVNKNSVRSFENKRLTICVKKTSIMKKISEVDRKICLRN